MGARHHSSSSSSSSSSRMGIVSSRRQRRQPWQICGLGYRTAEAAAAAARSKAKLTKISCTAKTGEQAVPAAKEQQQQQPGQQKVTPCPIAAASATLVAGPGTTTVVNASKQLFNSGYGGRVAPYP